LTLLSFFRLFNSSKYNLTILKLSSCLYINDDILQFICLNCLNIQELDLQSCENISKFLSISFLRNLKKLNLYRTKIKTNDLASIIHSCIKLESLNIGSCTEVNNVDWILQTISVYNP
jgi:hypothetical protein